MSTTGNGLVGVLSVLRMQGLRGAVANVLDGEVVLGFQLLSLGTSTVSFFLSPGVGGREKQVPSANRIRVAL